jgi:hypothetical protein
MASGAETTALQRFERHPIAHRMRKYGNLADFGIFSEKTQAAFELIARVLDALAVVSVCIPLGLRWPGEENRHDLRAGIIDKLSEAENRVFEAVVVPMDEDKHVPIWLRPEKSAKYGCRLSLVDGMGGFKCHEIRRRIAGDLGGFFTIASLVHRGNRNNNIGKVQSRPAVAGKHLRWLVGPARVDTTSIST